MIQQPSRQQVVKTVSIPAPIKGLNSKDAIAAMDPTYALILDNYTCLPTSVQTRNGSSTFATGLGNWVETVSHYTGGLTNKIFGVAGTSVFDITAGGAVGAAKVTGLSNAQWQWINFDAAGGTFLVMVNGTDLLLNFDGTNWTKVNGSSTYAITGVTTSTLAHVNVYQNTLWFVERNTLRMWYLQPQSIGGAANVFDLSSQFTLGGYMMAMMTWTIDNVNGIQDYAVFLSSEGEVLIYQGYNPAFAATFTLVGKFKMGRPVGRKCFTKMASDNIVICADGVVMLSKELTTDRDQSQGLSYNIEATINEDISSFFGNYGWTPVYYPLGNKVLINVPSIVDGVYYQYVMSTITGAWSTWNKLTAGYQAVSWDIVEDVLYAGGNGVVYITDTGESDSGNSIYSLVKPAFSYFGELGRSKYFTMVRAIWSADGTIYPNYGLCLDYNDISLLGGFTSTGSQPPWNTTAWNTSLWGQTGVISKSWEAISGVGYSASLKIATNTLGVQAQLQSIDYAYEPGGVL